MELTGRIKLINDTMSFGSNNFRKREIVLTTDEQYPQNIQIEFVQDKCQLLDQYVVGDNVTISINLRGIEWINPEGKAKYFNTIQGWRIVKVNNTSELANESASSLVRDKPDDMPF